MAGGIASNHVKSTLQKYNFDNTNNRKVIFFIPDLIPLFIRPSEFEDHLKLTNGNHDSLKKNRHWDGLFCKLDKNVRGRIIEKGIKQRMQEQSALRRRNPERSQVAKVHEK